MITKIKPGNETFSWAICRGMAWPQTFQALDENSVPRDLTGAAIRLLIAPSWRAPALLEATIGAGITVTDAATGSFAVLLTPIQTASLEAGGLVLDISITAADGLKLLHVRAKGEVKDTVDSAQGDVVVAAGADGLAELVDEAPELDDAVSATEVILISDPARAPVRRNKRKLKALLEVKQDRALAPGWAGEGSSARDLVEKLCEPYVSVLDHGGKPDGAVARGCATIAAGSHDLVLAELPAGVREWAADDLIVVPGAGANGGVLITTIQSVSSSTACRLSAPAEAAANGVSVAYGSDNTDAMATAISVAGKGRQIRVPRGAYLVRTLSPLDGQRFVGDSRDQIDGSIILALCPGDFLWKPSTETPRIAFQDICIAGAECTASFLCNNGRATKYLTLSNVTFIELRYVWDALSDGGASASYWFNSTHVQIRDCWHGYYWTNMDECSMSQTTFHPYDTLYEITYVSKAGAIGIGDTVVGAISGDTAVVRGVIPASPTAGTLLVSTPDGTNAAPLTIDFAVGETISSPAAGSAIIASVELSRQLYIEQSGGVTMTAVSANNGSFEFVDIENIIWSGGYVENYSDLQQAALILRNVAGQINIHLVSGSTLVADEPSSRNVRGALQANIRYAGETPTISAWPERFPNPALDAPAAVRAVAVNNMACAADPSGVGLRLTSNMATNSYAQLALSPPADAISALVGIKVLKGSLWIRAQNTQDNAGPTLTPADGHRLVRIASRVGQCRGPWLTGASYQLNDLVWSSGGWYKVTLALSHSTIAPGSDPSHFVAVGTNWPLVRLSCSALDGSGAFEAVITSINLTDVYGFINAPSLACPAYVLGETYPLVNLAAISNEGRVTIPASGNSPLFSMPGKTNTYLIVAHNENAAGSYTVAIATKNGTSLVVTQLMGTGATLSASGANVVLTNSTGTSVDYYWSALRVNW